MGGTHHDGVATLLASDAGDKIKDATEAIAGVTTQFQERLQETDRNYRALREEQTRSLSLESFSPSHMRARNWVDPS
jgi:hypothetical protein